MTKIVLCFYYYRMKSTDDDKRKKTYRNTLYFGATEKLKHCNIFLKSVAKLHFFGYKNVAMCFFVTLRLAIEYSK